MSEREKYICIICVDNNEKGKKKKSDRAKVESDRISYIKEMCWSNVRRINKIESKNLRYRERARLILYYQESVLRGRSPR